MGMISLDDVKSYARIDIDNDDNLLNVFITAAEEYLKNATGKEYPAKDLEENIINYELEKIYLRLLISYWYDQRSPVIQKNQMLQVGEEFSFMTRSIMLQLQNK